MTEQSPQNMFLWSLKAMLSLMKNGMKAEPRDIRERLVNRIDQRGLNLTDAAALHTLENSETMKAQLEELLTPRPGERTNLEKILELLEALARSNGQILKGQASLVARLDAIELLINELNGF